MQQVREGVLLLTTCSYTGTTSLLLPRCCSKGVCDPGEFVRALLVTLQGRAPLCVWLEGVTTTWTRG